MKAAGRVLEGLGKLGVYRPIILRYRGRIASAVSLNVFATVFEGFALILLLPLIALAVRGEVTRGTWIVPWIDRVAVAFGLQLSIPVLSR